MNNLAKSIVIAVFAIAAIGMVGIGALNVPQQDVNAQGNMTNATGNLTNASAISPQSLSAPIYAQ